MSVRLANAPLENDIKGAKEQKPPDKTDQLKA